MGWISELNTVYDLVTKNKKIDNKPLPLYHITNNALLEITLDREGNFRSAKLLGKAERDDWQTCMPCTEKSAVRSSTTIAPYPFCDKFEYVAGDYAKYAAGGKNLKEKHEQYCSLLESWARSNYSNQKIKNVYKYVEKGEIIKDILKRGNIPEMDTPEKIGNDKSNVFIRWNVEIPGDIKNKTWLDPEIQQLWINYYSTNYLNKKGFCYISGKVEPIASLHSKKIRGAGDSARLISSNDNSNYTFRGRFKDVNQACQIGMEVSVKAHNALRWLIERQGTIYFDEQGGKKIYKLAVVAWCSAPEIKPQLIKSSHDSWDDEDDEEDEYFASEETGKRIRNRLLGYYGKVPDSEKILIMAINSATPGRMSILLYREFIKSDFCAAQEYWHGHLAWFYTYWKEKKPHYTISAPSPEEIAKAAYGGHVSDSAKAMTIQRLLSCIIDKTPIPSDIEQLCFNRASRLNTIDSSEREKTLETACAVIKYNLYANKEKKEYKVGLEEDRKDRDYLYGRLLAVADKIESSVLDERGENRESNAVRYLQRFSKYPCSTWNLLYKEKLRPYLKYLKQMHPKLYGWYEGIIQNISDKFTLEDFSSDEALSGKFLLGYHCQQKDFWRKRENEQLANNNGQEE